MRNDNPIILNASASTSQTSAAIYTGFMLRISFQAVFTGTPNGNIQIQVSDDVGNQNNTPPTNWFNFNSAFTITSGAQQFMPSASPYYYEICHRWMRVVWTNTSGTGTIVVTGFAAGA
jgi:hypothetical protein